MMRYNLVQEKACPEQSRRSRDVQVGRVEEESRFSEKRYTMTDRKIEVGGVAPDFTLKDQNEEDVRLSDFKGKNKVVLSFHPLAWTSICKVQMQDLEKHREDTERLDAVALGLSVDSVPCKKAWAEAIGVKDTPLLADFWPHGGVVQAYGIFREKNGFSERSVFIVDKEGVVRFKKIYPIGEVPDIGEILKALEEL
jgi:peroxiredoxin